MRLASNKELCNASWSPETIAAHLEVVAARNDPLKIESRELVRKLGDLFARYPYAILEHERAHRAEEILRAAKQYADRDLRANDPTYSEARGRHAAAHNELREADTAMVLALDELERFIRQHEMDAWEIARFSPELKAHFQAAYMVFEKSEFKSPETGLFHVLMILTEVGRGALSALL